MTLRGYEVKVSRSDWLADEEVPAGIGVMRPTANGAALRVERKAARHDPEPAAVMNLLCYLLMSRTRVVADMWAANAAEPPTREQRVAEWRRRLAAADAGREIDRAIKGHLREREREFADENVRLRQRVNAFAALEAALVARGIDVTHPNDSEWWRRQVLAEYGADNIGRLRDAASALATSLGELLRVPARATP